MQRRQTILLSLGVLVASLGLALPGRAEDEAAFAAPSGVTLQAKAGGRYLLLWEPLEKDQALMGYSIWLRRKGEKEFIRLSVPVRVGQEVQKQPMISDAKVELKLGEGRKDLEFAVVAEYEDGPSPRSASAFSAKAALVPTTAVGSSPQPASDLPESPTAAVAAVSSTVEAAPPVKTDPYAEENARKDGKGPAPWDLRSARRDRPLLVPPGKIRTSFGAGYEVIRSIYSGHEPFANLRLYGTDIPDTRVVNWKRVDMHTRFRAPLRAEAGLLPGVELWAEGAYQAEDVTLNTYEIDGENFNYIRPVRIEPDGTLFYYPDPSSVSAGDTLLGARVQPLPTQPLVLLLQATLPTGLSHFKSYLDWEDGVAFQAGTGDGVFRLGAGATWGWRGLRPGPSFRIFYSPGTTERVTEKTPFIDFDHVVNRGDLSEAAFDYTIPWRVAGRDGAILFGAVGRSIGAARWTVNGVDVSPFFGPLDRGRLAAHAGLKFNRDDQLELGVEAMQDLPGGFETGGRLAYTTNAFGDQLQISGRLVY
jgi:hypothetical protein